MRLSLQALAATKLQASSLKPQGNIKKEVSSKPPASPAI
jgi:hypothetical protein